GAPGQPATPLGPTRVVAVVPAEATAGDLVVHSGNTSPAPLRFRRAAFALGWGGRVSGAPDMDEPQPDIGRPRPQLTEARVRFPLLNVDDRLVAIGGTRDDNDAGEPMPDVEVLLVNADGTVGSGRELSSVLAVPVHSHTAHRIGRYVHVLGGFNRG